MGFLTGFVGGMAGAYNDERDAEKLDVRKRQMADYENELLMKRKVMEETLRENFEKAKIQAKRTQDIADAKTIQDVSDAKRVERAQGIINADTGLNYTPDEVKNIIADPTWTQNYGARRDTANGQPTEWTEGGLINPTVSVTPSTDRTRAQELNDKADASMGIGRVDLEKGFRDQGNLERQTTAMENQAKASARLADLKEIGEERRATRDDWQREVADKRADATLRLAAAAEARAAKANGGGEIGREERIRYTSLFTEAGRRIGEQEKKQSTLSKELAEATKYQAKGEEDTPAVASLRSDLETIKENLKSYKEERGIWQSLLAGDKAIEKKESAQPKKLTFDPKTGTFK